MGPGVSIPHLNTAPVRRVARQLPRARTVHTRLVWGPLTGRARARPRYGCNNGTGDILTMCDAGHLAGPQHPGGEALADVAQPGRGEVGHQPPPVRLRGRGRGAHGSTIYTSALYLHYTAGCLPQERLRTADIRANAAPRHQSPESPSALPGPGESCCSVEGYNIVKGPLSIMPVLGSWHLK